MKRTQFPYQKTQEELLLLQSLPLETKILYAEEKIKEWYEYFNGDVYIAFSGGIDSTVLVDVARKIYPGIPAVFVDTGLEYPEIREFVKTFDNVEWLKPKMTFVQVLEKYGFPVVSKETALFIREARRPVTDKNVNLYNVRVNGIRKNGEKAVMGVIAKKWLFLLNAPFKISEQCCDVMKKNPSKLYEKRTNRAPIIGTMTEDSDLRKRVYFQHGCNGFEMNRPVSKPFSIWSKQDVLQYILQKSLPYCSVYGDIKKDIVGQPYTTKLDRTGCIFCMFGINRDAPDNNRFQRMYHTHPKLWKYCMFKLGLKAVLDYMSIPTEPPTDVLDIDLSTKEK